jgi:LPXTG-motif cell wall-anchored protein
MFVKTNSDRCSLIRIFRSNGGKTRKVLSALGIVPIGSVLSLTAMASWGNPVRAASFDYKFETVPTDLNVSSFFTSDGLPPNAQPNVDNVIPDPNNGVQVVPEQDGVLRLTGSGRQWQKTSAWQTNPRAIANGFETTFQFQISDLRDEQTDPTINGGVPADSSGNFGGDGFAFVLQTIGSDAISDIGGGDLGYGSLNNTLAIEFDTWDNTNDFEQFGDSTIDPLNRETSNHISIQGISEAPGAEIFGEFPRNSLAFQGGNDLPNLSSGNIFEVTIRYESSNLEVFLTDTSDLSGTSDTYSLSVENFNLTDILSGKNAWVGFTGSTGGSWQNQDILEWSFETLEDNKVPKEVPESDSWLAILGIASIGIGGWLWRRRS